MSASAIVSEARGDGIGPAAPKRLGRKSYTWQLDRWCARRGEGCTAPRTSVAPRTRRAPAHIGAEGRRDITPQAAQGAAHPGHGSPVLAKAQNSKGIPMKACLRNRTVVAALLALAHGSALAHTQNANAYVSSSGSESNNCATAARPCLNLQSPINATGTVVILGPILSDWIAQDRHDDPTFGGIRN